MEHVIHPIAHIRTDFPTKFGIPRQSGLVPELEGVIVFEPEYRDPEALRGLETYTHIWLIWQFSEGFASQSGEEGAGRAWHPTVRPPKLDGNTRVGVFASRSPNRPNSLGLSVVRMTGIELHTAEGPVIRVAGADLRHGTGILDIKPYLPYTDAHPDAKGGFADAHINDTLEVIFPDELKAGLSEDIIKAAAALLKYDPRPSYHDDPERIYGMKYAGYDFRFRVSGSLLTVIEVKPG